MIYLNWTHTEIALDIDLLLVNTSLWVTSQHVSFPFPILQENVNSNEAANFLVKHIMSTENDILYSVVPDTISPQLNSTTQVNCSACFKP